MSFNTLQVHLHDDEEVKVAVLATGTITIKLGPELTVFMSPAFYKRLQKETAPDVTVEDGNANGNEPERAGALVGTDKLGS